MDNQTPSNLKIKKVGSERKTKKKSQLEKIQKNGKSTAKGARAKKAMLEKRNDQINRETPRETVVDRVLDRDRLYSIALPPTFQKEELRFRSESTIEGLKIRNNQHYNNYECKDNGDRQRKD